MNITIFYFFFNAAHESAFLGKLTIFFAVYFPYLVMLGAAIFLLYHHEVLDAPSPLKEFAKKWKEILLVFFAGGFAWCVAKLLKILIHIDRPLTGLSDIKSLVTETGFSFPSGHATFFAALAVALFFCHKKVGYWFMLFAFLIGIARIAAGVHTPVDILAGFFLGACVAYFIKNV